MIRIADIQREVADLYGLPLSVMREPDGMWGSRERTRARPRQIAMYLSKKLCTDGRQRSKDRASLPAIGKLFGGRDHTTVLHGVKTIERLIQHDCEERRAVGEVGLRIIEQARL